MSSAVSCARPKNSMHTPHQSEHLELEGVPNMVRVAMLNHPTIVNLQCRLLRQQLSCPSLI
jgi:hypothetical protein